MRSKSNQTEEKELTYSAVEVKLSYKFDVGLSKMETRLTEQIVFKDSTNLINLENCPPSKRDEVAKTDQDNKCLDKGIAF